ncbi:mothers against decapentaplegic homolog 5-like [Aphidius gifuensis]|uniref:mothers against decapentaplegic homolog 5-like n=1 Tax=Aphidius gifuensis TaxID=684658 RepID=UPI001CDBBD80|nr:mothers against decapentaplegic homolog 5-like [Aphidius gifuensis]
MSWSIKKCYQKISPVVYEELDNWADIAYYEYNTRVGDVHHSHSQCIIIDGFSNPMDNTSRFSIGKLINPSRHPLSESIRKHIGKGLHLHYMGGQAVMIFNFEEFSTLISQRVNRGYEAVHELTKMCVMRASFVKGFGPEYPKRYDITLAPCWVEIRLISAFKWLDKVMTTMDSPASRATSYS